jgi:hypothetical protein
MHKGTINLGPFMPPLRKLKEAELKRMLYELAISQHESLLIYLDCTILTTDIYNSIHSFKFLTIY